MSAWQCRLDLTDVWDDAMEDKISIQELAKIVHDRLLILEPCKNVDVLERRDEIAEEFLGIYEDGDAGEQEFNDSMYYLYEWADTPLDDKFGGKKVCWVGTQF